MVKLFEQAYLYFSFIMLFSMIFLLKLIKGASDDDPDYIDLSEVEPGPQISNRTGVDQQGTESAYVDVNRKNTERRNYTQLLPQGFVSISGGNVVL